MAERGIAVSYETVRRWVNHFGPKSAADLRKRRPKPHPTWRLGAVDLRIDGRLVYLWRAVDGEGEVLDVLVQTKRNRAAAMKLMRKLLWKYGALPVNLITDHLRSYHAAARDLGIAHKHRTGRWRNNRAENSHQPTRRRERNARLQKHRFRAKNSLLSRRRLQHLQHSTPFHLKKSAPSLASLGHGHMAFGRCCSMSTIVREIT